MAVALTATAIDRNQSYQKNAYRLALSGYNLIDFERYGSEGGT